ncbi:unnamed protein product [Brassicogethes aeneus]|uniref:Uncharacterized protein n=1 Tax=Brassicogethes aeneus TaxID=1431903 RepID=A0A9P0BF91_BRAAE|nr:unnamed protein product [Brassicogethes aeneus]
MWDVIVWQEEKKDGIDYVPTSWANGEGQYKWPKNCSRLLLEKLIDSCDTLQNIKFKLYKAIPKKIKVKSRQKAKEYCEKGQITSNLESNCETDDESAVSTDEEPLIKRKKDAKAKLKKLDVQKPTSINDIKIALSKASSNCEKYKLLTTLPSDWNERKIHQEFNVSLRMASNAKKLRQTRGYGATPKKRTGRPLSNNVVEEVENIYISDK